MSEGYLKAKKQLVCRDDGSQKDLYSFRAACKKVGITEEDYLDLLHDQDGKCAVCGRHSDEASRRLSIDHDHKTGRVRGLLCHKCNVGLGMFNDDTGVLNRAIDYLMSHWD